jgi:hypothetical protein
MGGRLKDGDSVVLDVALVSFCSSFSSTVPALYSTPEQEAPQRDEK